MSTSRKQVKAASRPAQDPDGYLDLTNQTRPAQEAQSTVAISFDPDCDDIRDLVAPIPEPSDEQIKVGMIALDAYYDGTKDAPIEGSLALTYRAMKALDRSLLPAHAGETPGPSTLAANSQPSVSESRRGEPAPATLLEKVETANRQPVSERELDKSCGPQPDPEFASRAREALKNVDVSSADVLRKQLDLSELAPASAGRPDIEFERAALRDNLHKIAERAEGWQLRAAIKICREVGELPDRTSPDDNADMMLVTADELRAIVTDVLAVAPASPLGQTRAESSAALEKVAAKALIKKYTEIWPGSRPAMPEAIQLVTAVIHSLAGGTTGATLTANKPPLTYDDGVERLRLADDLVAGEKQELDTHEMCIVVAALRESTFPASPLGQEWRPTESAPKDDQAIILLTKNGGCIVSGTWRARTSCWWAVGGTTFYPDQIAGWLPRTALPTRALTSAQGYEDGKC